MSTDATTWFYRQPEKQPYLVTERLNGTFWQARVVEVYWRCVQTEPTYRAYGYYGPHTVEMEWAPNDWLSLSAPKEMDIRPLVEAIAQRILWRPPCLTYFTHGGHQVYEWHVDGGKRRWVEIQGRGEFVRPRRLNARS